MLCSSCCTTAPELLAAAVRAGLAVSFSPHGMTFVQVTNRRSSRQRRALDALRENPFVIALMQGIYYPGDYMRVQ